MAVQTLTWTLFVFTLALKGALAQDRQAQGASGDALDAKYCRLVVGERLVGAGYKVIRIDAQRAKDGISGPQYQWTEWRVVTDVEFVGESATLAHSCRLRRDLQGGSRHVIGKAMIGSMEVVK